MAQLKPRIKTLERDQARRKRPREYQLSFAFGDAPEAQAREGEAVVRFDFGSPGEPAKGKPE
jgi:hypothetical protein